VSAILYQRRFACPRFCTSPVLPCPHPVEPGTDLPARQSRGRFFSKRVKMRTICQKLARQSRGRFFPNVVIMLSVGYAWQASSRGLGLQILHILPTVLASSTTVVATPRVRTLVLEYCTPYRKITQRRLLVHISHQFRSALFVGSTCVVQNPFCPSKNRPPLCHQRNSHHAFT
jgi:hypothetical protein